MTWADKLVAEGRTEGLDEGRTEGLRQMLRRFLEKRFGPLSATARERLEAIDDPEALDRLGDRIFDARSLDELGLA